MVGERAEGAQVGDQLIRLKVGWGDQSKSKPRRGQASCLRLEWMALLDDIEWMKSRVEDEKKAGKGCFCR